MSYILLRELVTIYYPSEREWNPKYVFMDLLWYIYYVSILTDFFKNILIFH